MAMTQRKFWSDDFDMDLLKIYPNIVEALGATADIRLWTISHDTYGRINCPVAWNTYTGLQSFLWLYNPLLDLFRNKDGWIRIDGFVCNEPVLECTWLEWLRDMWSHQHGWLLIPSGNIANVERGGVHFAGMDWWSFEKIMWHMRGWNDNLPETDQAIQVKSAERGYAAGWLWLTKANRRFARTVENAKLEREQHLYLPLGSVPGHNGPAVGRPAMPEVVRA